MLTQDIYNCIEDMICSGDSFTPLELYQYYEDNYVLKHQQSSYLKFRKELINCIKDKPFKLQTINGLNRYVHQKYYKIELKRKQVIAATKCGLCIPNKWVIDLELFSGDKVGVYQNKSKDSLFIIDSFITPYDKHGEWLTFYTVDLHRNIRLSSYLLKLLPPRKSNRYTIEHNNNKEDYDFGLKIS